MTDDTSLSEDSKALLRILETHARWVETNGKEGNRANLQGAFLMGASLLGANLEKADLQLANLQGAHLLEAKLQGAFLGRADLRGANLEGAKLQGAKLQEASLQGANLQGANLQGLDLRSFNLEGTNLRNADLSNAKLGGVAGLRSGQLGGANLTRADLPTDINEFEGLPHVTEISKHARNVFLAVVGGCLYSWLTIATTTDVALLTDTVSTPLPIIQTKVPIAGFFLVAPAILLALYIYLHMYLQRLWEGLASLPAIFPDGRSLDERTYPWLLSGLVRAHVPRLKKNRPAFSRLQVFLSFISAWALVPATIAIFWLRYLPLHDWNGTGPHVALIVLAITFGGVFYLQARTTLRGQERLEFTRKTFWENLSLYILTAFFIFIAAAVYKISSDSINGITAWFPPLTANLEGADLESANLQGVNLIGANLQGASLSFVTLFETNISGADLRFSDGLSQEELRNACADPENPPTLPSGLTPPPGGWKPCPELE